jgi:hypothetical protein
MRVFRCFAGVAAPRCAGSPGVSCASALYLLVPGAFAAPPSARGGGANGSTSGVTRTPVVKVKGSLSPRGKVISTKYAAHPCFGVGTVPT